MKNKTRLDLNNSPLPKSTVEVSWSLVSFSTMYEVNITKTKSGLVVYQNFTSPETDRVLIEQVLDHYTVYRATVRAFSEGGRGPVSIGYRFRTDEGCKDVNTLLNMSRITNVCITVPSLPLNFEFVGHTHNAVQVAWSPPLYPNGVLTGYELSCAKIDYIDDSWHTEGNFWFMYPTVTDRIYNVTGLAAETYYVCLLAGKNDRYRGHQEQVLPYTDYSMF